MESRFKIFTYLSAIMGMLLFIRPKERSLNAFLWFPKLIAGALAPVISLTAGLGTLLGFIRKDFKLAAAGMLGAGFASRFMADIPDAREQFAGQFSVDWKTRSPSREKSQVDFQSDLVIGQKPVSGKPFLADLWQPREDEPRSGIGIIYSHGSGWRVGDKDMLTRPFFRHLVGQGHVLLDIAYSLYPEADLPTMVQEVNQAILWMKDKSQQLQIDPERIVLIGASAGAHLSLLAAYAQGQPEFQAASASGDTSVRGVVAYYPPVDLQDLHASNQDSPAVILRPVEEMANAMFTFIFNLGPQGLDQEPGKKTEFDDLIVEMLGGTVEEIPQVYNLLSPINHIHKNCPATLILQGSDDVFELAAPVRRFHRALQEVGVPVVLVEYPHAEHGFDLFFPQISPLAQAATREVEHFLELMI